MVNIKIDESSNTLYLMKHLARTEGANSNTFPQDFEVTDSLIQSMIDLAFGLKHLGIEVEENL
jgi:hypothetical protein